mmetsp:Transcript_30707/g.72492  ORF Transcript_30707/g.72492 Transcript_30707/m.72492 type:complete len:264 (-) Transcript_30707:368-1159(-)
MQAVAESAPTSTAKSSRSCTGARKSRVCWSAASRKPKMTERPSRVRAIQWTCGKVVVSMASRCERESCSFSTYIWARKWVVSWKRGTTPPAPRSCTPSGSGGAWWKRRVMPSSSELEAPCHCSSSRSMPDRDSTSTRVQYCRSSRAALRRSSWQCSAGNIASVAERTLRTRHASSLSVVRSPTWRARSVEIVVAVRVPSAKETHGSTMPVITGRRAAVRDSPPSTCTHFRSASRSRTLWKVLIVSSKPRPARTGRTIGVSSST